MSWRFAKSFYDRAAQPKRRERHDDEDEPQRDWRVIVLLATIGAFCVVVFVTALVGQPLESRSPEGAEIPQVPMTAEGVFDEMTLAANAGNVEHALRAGRRIIAEFAGSAEADSAEAMLPALEAEWEEVREARRIRAAEEERQRARQRLADKWTYDESTDPMTSRSTRRASIRSENTVNFDWPYSGPQHARLTLRTHPTYGRDVIFRIERGQIQCPSYSGCTIRVRFDESPPVSWRANAAADHSTEVIFLSNHNGFIQRMRSAETVRIQIPVYRQGRPTFDFAVGGYSHDRYLEP